MSVYRWIKLLLGALFILILASLLWRMGLLLPTQKAILSLPTMPSLSEAEQDCMVIEVAESAKSKEDALLVAQAVFNEKKNGSSACEIFNSYTLLRHSTARTHWAVRDIRFIRIRARTVGGVHAARVRRGEWAVEQLLSNPTANHVELSPRAKELFPCVVRIVRSPKNLLQKLFRPAGRNAGKLRREMGKSWRNPSTGTEFFCPR